MKGITKTDLMGGREQSGKPDLFQLALPFTWDE